MSFPLVSFKVNSILMEKRQKNATVALPVNATLGDRNRGGGVSAATLFYKFRPGALTVHASKGISRGNILFNDGIKTNH